MANRKREQACGRVTISHQSGDRLVSCMYPRSLRAPEGSASIFFGTAGLLLPNRVRGRGNFNRRIALSIFFALFIACFFLPAGSWANKVNSKSVAVMDAETGNLLYAKNPDLKCAPASTTKLMTAILAVEHLNLDAVVTVSANASRVSPHKAGLRTGERIAVEELLYAALLSSANDAAVALAEAVAGSENSFAQLMNRKARLIGARDTRFVNSNGLPGAGQYTTASDMSRIMQYALQYPKLKQIINTRVAEISTESGRPFYLRNTNRLLWSEEGLIGGKTGYTRKARHCFVCVAERGDDKVVVTLLGSPTRENLWRESGLLIDRGFNMLNNGEEPMIYLAKTDYAPAAKQVSKKKSKRLKKKTVGTKKSPVFVADNSQNKKKAVMAKKKGKPGVQARHKGKQKKIRTAGKGSLERDKG